MAVIETISRSSGRSSPLRRKLRHRLTYANIMSTLAVFLVLGGGAYAANEWNSSNIQNETLLSQDLKDNAAVRTGDVVNDTVTGGGLTSPDIRNGAVLGRDIGNAQVTDNDLANPGAFLRPTFNQGWTNYGGIWEPVGYRRERGRVFLQGMARFDAAPMSSRDIFVLPAGYRPAKSQIFTVNVQRSGFPPEEARLDVGPDGVVHPSFAGTEYVSLSGVSFAAGQ